MVAFVETGDLRSLRADDEDRGKFTVQCTDVPLASLRRKNQGKNTQQKGLKKKVRLTPITEELDRERSLISTRCISGMKDTVMTQSAPNILYDSAKHSILVDSHSERSKTPVMKKQFSISKILSDVADAYEEELENIPKEPFARSKDSTINKILRELPPRPKCGRKVLPPSITGVDIAKEKRSKLSKRRSKSSNTDGAMSVSPVREFRAASFGESSTIKRIIESDRPKSADGSVRVIRLADLSSSNSTSVPDLPLALSKLSKPDAPDVHGYSAFEDSGALSTPRRPSESPLGPISWDNSCLKGSEISSFYNMWEMDRKKRPFDKKGQKVSQISFNRSCMCSLRQFGDKKCTHTKTHFLPPLH